ncbi:MAG: hypothetical protein V4643_12535 [Bacteroidota bacterium]
MKNSFTKIATALLLVNMSLMWGCGPTPVIEPSYLPQDVKQSCTINSTDFNKWYASGTAAQNGFVLPANSVTFPHRNNCDFYLWSHQMFLWITSPVSSGQYKSGNTVLESPVFYTVSPAENGKRELIPHVPNTPLRVNSHISQNGPNKLPVIIDREGRLFEVENSNTNGKVMLLNNAGKQVELDHIETLENGLHTFIDKQGKEIQQPKALLKSKINTLRVVQEFKTNGKSIFLDAQGNTIDTEVGQATQDGLIDQHGSLVYYISMVNDVYAYFLTGGQQGVIDTTTFPTTEGARDSICAFARTHGTTLLDSNALAIELKTSWVETTNLPNLGSYITIDAVVPNYDKTNPNKWIPKGERTTKLALIGMHIVGSADKHPELIWATFEHRNNAPNASYTYLDSTGRTKTVPKDTGTHWLLSNNANADSVNHSHIGVSGDTLVGKNGYVIGASNTLRTKPWGTANNVVPNAEDVSAAASNSEIISLNNAINSLLVGNDIRKNYYLLGATWTKGGHGPNGLAYPANSMSLNDAIGTSQLANSTMETYFQFDTLYNQNGSCFRCHSNSSTQGLYPNDLSHIFAETKPLTTFKKK